MDLGLHDSVIVVTGGGAGIGQAISRACLDEGATVVVVSRASDNVKDFLAEMLNRRRKCDFVEAHLADVSQCERAIDYVRHRYGRIVGLVNNAGANDGIGLESGSPERFVESLQQNLVHYYAMAHYALPMLKASRGSVVNISSKVALTGQEEPQPTPPPKAPSSRSPANGPQSWRPTAFAPMPCCPRK